MTRAAFTRHLDANFSYFVRLRYADDAGRVTCATCDDPTPRDWREMQCGHFVSRRHYLHRWEVANCAPQCPKCNRFDQGRQWALGQWIDAQHGPGTAARLWSTRNEPAPPAERVEELTSKLEHWKAWNLEKIKRVAATQVAAALHKQQPNE